MMMKKGVEKNDCRRKQTKDFLLTLKRVELALSSRALPSPSAAPVDVKRYNYALIYRIVALSMHKLLGIQRDNFASRFLPQPSLPHPLFAAVSPRSYK